MQQPRAPDTVDIQDALANRSEQSKQFSSLLSSDFHTIVKKKGKLMKKSLNRDNMDVFILLV